MDKKALLKELIKDKGIVIPEKPVKLSGGGESLYYYDIMLCHRKYYSFPNSSLTCGQTFEN
jgi:hypothetical protein